MSRIYFGSKIFTLNAIKSEFKNQIVQIYETEQEVNRINKFFDNDKLFLYINPNSSEIKIIENQIDKNIGLNFIYFENENFDGRLSLIQNIKKNNNIYNMNYPVLGDFLSFKRHLISHLKTLDIKIKSDCLEWLINNSPIYRLKSKINKKEELYYDLDLLFKEIEKISSFKNEICIEDFENSLFKKDDDIFVLIDSILNKNLEKSCIIYDKLKSSIGEQAMLMIIIHQIIFLINLIGLKNKKQYDINKIIELIELKDLLGVYLDENWQKTSFQIKAQNPLRIKISYSKYNKNIEEISKIFEIFVDGLLNLRKNTENSVIGFLMLYKACNV